MQEAADLRLITRAYGALASMSGRYWTTVIAIAKRQLRRWRAQALAIPDPGLRALALGKLADEQANVYFAATFATLAPRRLRTTTTEVIVAVQVIYDYLDGVTEQAAATEPLRDGLQLFHALSDAVSPSSPRQGAYYSHHPVSADGGYLSRLVTTARDGLAALPTTEAITDLTSAAAARCTGAQVRAHATVHLGTAQLERWAIEQIADDEVSWREFLAAAASAVISIHALIATAADPHTTREQAARVDSFHECTCTLATILDGFADLARDQHSADKQIGYLHYFPDQGQLSTQLVEIAHRAIQQAPVVPNGAHHLMTLAGVVAYYVSAIGQDGNPAKAIVAPLQHELEPVITPTLAFMRAWRFVEHVHGHGAGCDPSLRRTHNAQERERHMI